MLIAPFSANEDVELFDTPIFGEKPYALDAYDVVSIADHRIIAIVRPRIVFFILPL
jgi:hypothetical protein